MAGRSVNPQLINPPSQLAPMACNRTCLVLRGVLMTWTTSMYRPRLKRFL